MTGQEDDDYKCTLTEYSLQKAIKELNENPKQRLGAIQSLRKWIKEQPHYTCRTDTNFLLAILRRAKFSQLVARELIENIMTLRTAYPEYLTNIDIQDANMLAFIEVGAIVYLPNTDKEGRTIILMRPGMLDFSNPKFQTKNEMRCNHGLGEMYRHEDENISVNGLMLVYDLTGVGLKYMNSMSMEQKKIITKLLQDFSPERVKAYIVYNAGAALELVMSLTKLLFKKKNRERIQTHDTMESVYKVIPMEFWPKEYLPDDYNGPSAGSIASITAGMKKRMMNAETRARILANTSDKYRINESKRPSGGVPNESFRKLNVD